MTHEQVRTRMGPSRAPRGTTATLVLASVAFVFGPVEPRDVRAGSRTFDPAQVVPMELLLAERRGDVADVISENSFHKQGKPETFPANPQLYLALLNEPALTLALWQDLSPTPVRLRQVGPGRFEGDDGAGTRAVWEFVLRTPRLHVLYCDLEHTTPRGNARLNGRIVLVVRTAFFKDAGGDSWIKHEIEAFVKIDSRGWKAVAATVRPLIEKLLEDQIEEAGWFVSLMARMVEMYPNWATTVCESQSSLAAPTRKSFTDLVAKTRRPGAFAGRPQLVDNRDGRVRR